MIDVFRARAFRLALAFSVAISVATAAAFAFIYLQVSSADIAKGRRGARRRGGQERGRQRGAAARGAGAAPDARHPPPGFCRPVRSTGRVDVRQRAGACRPFRSMAARMSSSNTSARIRSADPRAGDLCRAPTSPTAACFCSGGACVRSTTCRRRCCARSAIALLPTILLILAIGALFARRASQRFDADPRRHRQDHERRPRFAFAGRQRRRRHRQGGARGQSHARRNRAPARAAQERGRQHRPRSAHAARRRARQDRARARQRGRTSNICARTMEAALAQIEKVSATISAILRVSAVENGARKTQFKDFDLAAICAQVVDFYEPLAESKGVTMIVDADEPVSIRGDPDLMREALSNLIDNAIKFTPAGGTVRIEVGMASRAPVRAGERHGRRRPAARARKDIRPLLSRRAERPIAWTRARPQHRRDDRQSARLQADGRGQQPRSALRIARRGVHAGEAGAGTGVMGLGLAARPFITRF